MGRARQRPHARDGERDEMRNEMSCPRSKTKIQRVSGGVQMRVLICQLRLQSGVSIRAAHTSQPKKESENPTKVKGSS